MKKTVKILIAALFAVGFGSLANAQSASISANATVISELKVTNNANLNFGTVVVGQTKKIDGYGNVEVSTGPKLGSTSLGGFRIEAQTGSNVRLTFEFPTNLSTTEGALLPISFTGTEGASSATIDLGEGDRNEFNPRSPYQINGFLSGATGSYMQVFIGGNVNATGVTAGTYTGTITLSATYN